MYRNFRPPPIAANEVKSKDLEKIPQGRECFSSDRTDEHTLSLRTRNKREFTAKNTVQQDQVEAKPWFERFQRMKSLSPSQIETKSALVGPDKSRKVLKHMISIKKPKRGLDLVTQNQSEKLEKIAQALCQTKPSPPLPKQSPPTFRIRLGTTMTRRLNSPSSTSKTACSDSSGAEENLK